MQDPNTYHIQTDHFEGPFDLLLFFIQRDEIDIYDIPISQITEDFLAYIRHHRLLWTNSPKSADNRDKVLQLL